ncbi:hypothetical protein D3C71_881560 [compost metagenome]
MPGGYIQISAPSPALSALTLDHIYNMEKIPYTARVFRHSPKMKKGVIKKNGGVKKIGALFSLKGTRNVYKYSRSSEREIQLIFPIILVLVASEQL